MLAIARALAVEPSLLIIDEATTGLMPIAVEAMQEAVRQLNAERGLAVLLVERREFRLPPRWLTGSSFWRTARWHLLVMQSTCGTTR